MYHAKISIIIPVFNTEPYLRECLDSVIQQTLKEIEIICINDGSTDNSLNILQEYAENDNRITVINKENGGQGVARNIAMKQARGEYLGFVDSDDWIDIHMCDELYTSAKNFSSDITLFEYQLFNTQTNILSRPESTKLPFDKKLENLPIHRSDLGEILFHFNSAPWNKLYRTDFVKEIDAKFAEGYYYQDILFVYHCILRARVLNFIGKPYYTARYLRSTSVTADKGKRQMDIFPVMKLLENEIEQDNLLEKAKTKFYEYQFDQFIFHFNEINREYKKEFWRRIKSEFNKLENDTKNYLFERYPGLAWGLKYGMAFYFMYEILIGKTRDVLNFSFYYKSLRE